MTLILDMRDPLLLSNSMLYKLNYLIQDLGSY